MKREEKEETQNFGWE